MSFQTHISSVGCYIANKLRVSKNVTSDETIAACRRRRRARSCGLRVAQMIGIVVAIFTLLSADCTRMTPPNGAGGSREPVLPGRSPVDRLVNALPTCVTGSSGDPTAHIQVTNSANRAFLVFVGGEAKALVANDPRECNLRINGLPDTPTRLSMQLYEYTEASFGVTNQGGNNVIRPNDGINVYVERPGLVLASTVQQPYRIQVDPNSGGDALGIITFKYTCSGNTSVDIYDVSLGWSCPSDLSNTPQVGKVLTIANTITQFDISRPLENHQFAYFYIGEHDSRAVSCGLSSPVSLSSSYTHDEIDITCAPTTPTLTVQNNHTEPVVIFANNHRLEGDLSFFKNAPNARRNVATIRGGARQLYRLQPGDYTIKAFLLTDIRNATSVSGETPFAQSRYESGSSIDLAVDVTCTITGRGLMQCVQSLPDLAVLSESIEVDRNSVNIGGEIVVSLKVHNDGDGGAAAATLRYYRSVDATIDSTDTSVGTGTIGVLSAGTTSPRLPHRISISDALAPGVYYYGACVERVEHETNTNNNCSSGVMVMVTEPLAAPDLTVRGGNRQVSLSWGSVSNASSYRIYWGTSSGSLTRLSANLTGTSYTHTGLADGITYYYQVSAYNSVRGEGGRSSLRSATTTTSPLGSRDGSKDFNTLRAAGNTNLRGIWSNGTTLWVTDKTDDKIYAYNLATKAYNRNADFNTLRAAGNNDSQGIWSDGTTLWVVDAIDDKIYAYNLLTKARDSAKDFNTLIAAGNNYPLGLWSDGTTMWVTDATDEKIYAYNLASKARDSSKDFNTLRAAGNTSSYGIWSDGTTLWVGDETDDKIYAYNMASKARDSSKDFNTLSTAGNNHPLGLWSDGTTMWVADLVDNKIYAYHHFRMGLPTPTSRDSAKDFNTLGAAGNNDPRGIWSDGTTMWVADLVDDKIYAYNLATKAYNRNADFNTLIAAGNNNPIGIWSDGTTMWVADIVDNKIYAYNLTSKAYNRNADFNTLRAAGNYSPLGIWSDGTTMWVADQGDDKIYAYNLLTKARDSAKDFNTLIAARNNLPHNLWSDGTTMWVADYSDDAKIYAYNLASKSRDSAKDFNTLRAAGNNNPAGIWSDGTTMWVADYADYKIYAYHHFR